MWRAFWKSGRSQCSRTRDALSGYLDRRLNPEEAARVEEHLSTCQGCQEELESLRATVALLHSLPEVTPSRSFALAAVKPLPGRMVLPAVRFATATAVLLLVAAIAVDGTGVLEERAPYDTYYAPSAVSEADTDYWLVPGERNDIAGPEYVKAMSVNLVVPDGSDNATAALDSLASGGVVLATIETDPEGVPQLVLRLEEDAANVQEFAVVLKSDGDTGPFSPSGPAETSALDEIVSTQEGEFLNIVPANSDNTVLYAFDLGKSVPAEIRRVPEGDSGTWGSEAAFGTGDEPRWLRPLEYSLIVLAAVLGVATAVLWVRHRRARVREVSRSR